MTIEDKHLEHLAKIQAVTNQAWYSWNSPVGLSIFFVALAIIGLIIRFAMVMK